jgi:cysteine desulfurase
MIYLDNNATTRVDPDVRQAMLPWLDELYANPSSPYGIARRSARALHDAREQVASLVEADPAQVIFTSGGTEANNTALALALTARPERRRLVISGVEHASVLETAQWWAAQGKELVVLPCGRDGAVDLEACREALSEDTALVSVMRANNETGILYPLPEIAELAHARGAWFHTDAVQAAGKIPLRLAETGADMLSISGHKLHATKGIGSLVVSSDLPRCPLMHGGGQENNLRGGTQNMPGIVAMGKAAEIASATLPGRAHPVADLRDRFENALTHTVPGITVLGKDAPRLPNTCAILVAGVEAEALIARLDLEEIYFSSGSACAAGSSEPSHVLSAMGYSPAEAKTALRFSLSRFTTPEEVDTVLRVLPGHIEALREIGPATSAR